MANEQRISYNNKLVLGRGGFGTIFLGDLNEMNENNQTIIKIPVAVKRIEIDGVNDEELENDREKIHQLKLDHPNVVKLLHCEDYDSFR